MKIKCACGCGRFTKEGKRFIQWHSNKGNYNPMWGKENNWGHHTEKTRKKISRALKGRHISKEHRIKIGLALKGKYVGKNNRLWGKKRPDFTGKNHPQWGTHHSLKTRLKMRKAWTIERKRKVTETMSGKNHPNWGKCLPHSEKTKLKISKAHIKYKLNANFFKKMTPASAYVLGFWMADGSAGKPKNLISFSQKEKEPLEKIKKSIGSTHPIPCGYSSSGFMPYSPHYRFQFCCKQWYKDLQKLCRFNMSKKSYLAKYPLISKEFDRHFIRGVFDGDGCIIFDKAGQAHFSIVGTKKLLKKIQTKLSCINGVNAGYLHQRKTNCWELAFVGNLQVLKIGRWLYTGVPHLFLERKKEKFQQLFSQQKEKLLLQKQKMQRNNKIAQKYLSGLSCCKLAKEFDVCHQTILNIVLNMGGIIRKQKRFTDDQEQLIAHKYFSGLSSCKLAKIYNTNPQLILRIVKRREKQ